jgi:hypothetical protein
VIGISGKKKVVSVNPMIGMGLGSHNTSVLDTSFLQVPQELNYLY